MSKLDTLSTRERQVFDMIAAGLNPAVIADRLCLSVKTVSTYRARILEKLGVRSNAELATLHCAARLSVADDHAMVAAALRLTVAALEGKPCRQQALDDARRAISKTEVCQS